MSRILVTVSKELHEQIRKTAEQNGMSMSTYLRNLHLKDAKQVATARASSDIKGDQ